MPDTSSPYGEAWFNTINYAIPCVLCILNNKYKLRTILYTFYSANQFCSQSFATIYTSKGNKSNSTRLESDFQIILTKPFFSYSPFQPPKNLGGYLFVIRIFLSASNDSQIIQTF